MLLTSQLGDFEGCNVLVVVYVVLFLHPSGHRADKLDGRFQNLSLFIQMKGNQSSCPHDFLLRALLTLPYWTLPYIPLAHFSCAVGCLGHNDVDASSGGEE